MTKPLQITLGVLTAIGGMIDIGNLVGNTEAGARFGMSLAWALVLGGVTIVLYANMAGKVAAISHRATFDVIRERLGPRVALVNLTASALLTVLTTLAEIAGIGLVLELATGVTYRVWIPLAALVLGAILWFAKFEHMERVYGVAGLAMLVLLVAVWRLHPASGELLHRSTHPWRPPHETLYAYWYLAIAQFGAMTTPYEVFFFSSGAVEERWTTSDLNVERANVFIGFPLGTLLALALMILGAVELHPRGIAVSHLSQVGLPITLSLGRSGMWLFLFGSFAAVFGAAAEASLSTAYSICQYFGRQWGKYVRRSEAPMFFRILIATLVIATVGGLMFDPIKVTLLAIVLSAAAIPLTFFPIFIVANDPDFVGDKVNGVVVNALSIALLAVMIVMSLATIPLLIVTRGNV
ncbi:MAG TPA: divalent metal cation transporter [Acidimicrobiia bacterium]|nr:divalent metal cation transporter [Acidimicrobiia bacterium]